MALKYVVSNATYDLGKSEYTNVSNKYKRLNYIASGKTYQLGLATDTTASEYSPLKIKAGGSAYYIGKSFSSTSSTSTLKSTASRSSYDYISYNITSTRMYWGTLHVTSTEREEYETTWYYEEAGVGWWRTYSSESTSRYDHGTCNFDRFLDHSPNSYFITNGNGFGGGNSSVDRSTWEAEKNGHIGEKAVQFIHIVSVLTLPVIHIIRIIHENLRVSKLYHHLRHLIILYK